MQTIQDPEAALPQGLFLQGINSDIYQSGFQNQITCAAGSAGRLGSGR